MAGFAEQQNTPRMERGARSRIERHSDVRRSLEFQRPDLYTTRLRVAGGQKTSAFVFKGKGLMGLLTPARMGKNADQIHGL